MEVSFVTVNRVVVVFMLAFFGGLAAETAPNSDYLNIEKLIESQGYPVEFHQVTTEDGYILGVHRMPAQGGGSGVGTVLMSHGLLTNAGCFVANMPQNDLAFMLWDAGYDVWLVNHRGTNSSQGHTSMTAKEAEYWDFSFSEMGKYDLVSAMDLIKDVTGINRVSLIGHSQGTSVVSVMLSMRPEYAARVNIAILLAPAIVVNNTKQQVFRLAHTLRLFELAKKIGIHHVGIGQIGQYLPTWLCNKLETLCTFLFEEMVGWDYSNVNKSRMNIFSGRGDYTSVKDFIHGYQNMDTGIFRDFDYGEVKNQIKYGQQTPPLFPLDKITTPISIYYGGTDLLVDEYDVEKYVLPLFKSQGWAQPPKLMKMWNHLDFIWSVDGSEYHNMVNLINQYNK